MGVSENGCEELKHIFGDSRERQEEVRSVWVAGEMDIEALYRWKFFAFFWREKREREASFEGNDGKRRIMITKGQGEDEVEIFSEDAMKKNK